MASSLTCLSLVLDIFGGVLGVLVYKIVCESRDSSKLLNLRLKVVCHVVVSGVSFHHKAVTIDQYWTSAELILHSM